MKSILFSLCALILLAGCATSSTYSTKVEKPEQYLVDILTLVGVVDSDFSKLDSATYESYIRGKFNNFEESEYRNHLQQTIKYNLMSRAQTRVLSSSDVFKVNQDVSYNEFLEEIRATGARAILFVNLRSAWYTYTYDPNNYFNKPEPNALFHTYLIDVNTLQPIWHAKTNVNGVYAGFNTLNNTLARQLFRRLKKDNYILAPQNYSPYLANQSRDN